MVVPCCCDFVSWMCIGDVTSCCDCEVAFVLCACLCDVTSCCDSEVAFMLWACLRGLSLCVLYEVACGVVFVCCVVLRVYVSVAVVMSCCWYGVVVFLSRCSLCLFPCCVSTCLSDINVVKVSMLSGKNCGSVICVSCCVEAVYARCSFVCLCVLYLREFVICGCDGSQAVEGVHSWKRSPSINNECDIGCTKILAAANHEYPKRMSPGIDDCFLTTMKSW